MTRFSTFLHLFATTLLLTSTASAQVVDAYPTAPYLGQQIEYRALKGLSLECDDRPTGTSKTDTIPFAVFPPGWIVIGAEFEETSRAGISDAQVSVVPAGYENLTEITRQGSNELLYKTDVAILEEFGMKIDAHRKVQDYASFYSHLSVNAMTASVTLNVDPRKPFSGRSWISGNLVVTMMYVGTRQDFEDALEEAKEIERECKRRKNGNPSQSGAAGDTFVTSCGARLQRVSGDRFILYYDNAGPQVEFRQMADGMTFYFAGEGQPPYGIHGLIVQDGYLGKYYYDHVQPVFHEGWDGYWVDNEESNGHHHGAETLPTTSRRIFAYEGGGWFIKGNGKVWKEVWNGTQTMLLETAVTPEYIELFDSSRHMYLRLYVDSAWWWAVDLAEWLKWPGSDGRWIE